MNRPLLLLFSFLLVLGGCASPVHRDKAIDLLGELRAHPVVAGLESEYASVEETFSKGEQQRELDTAAADRYYELTLLKAELYQRKLHDNLRTIARQRLGYRAKRKSPFPPAPKVRSFFLPELVSRSFHQEVAKPKLIHLTSWQFNGSDPAIMPRLTFADFLGSQVAGAEQIYLVQQGESLSLIGAKLGMSWRRLAKMNGIDPKKRLKAGQALKYDNRRIIPKTIKNGIVINIPDRTLYFFKSGQLATAVPVAVGMSEKDGSIWQTPTGRFKIVAKVKNPAWNVPPSIQAEMEKEGKEVLEVVPPGDANPLGKYALRTSIPGILIHSTNLPASIYGFSSHGCIRVHPEHMEEFFQEVRLKTAGEIIYEPIKIAETDDGRILLEVHPDIYRKVGDMTQVVRQRLMPVEKRISWERVEAAIKRQRGIPEDITLLPKPVPVRLAGN